MMFAGRQKRLQMALVKNMKTALFGTKKATICELPDKLQLTVHGKENESVTIRLLDSSSKPLSFFDDGYVAALEFTIPPDRESLEVDFAKADHGEYTFEVRTPAGTTLLDYRTA